MEQYEIPKQEGASRKEMLSAQGDGASKVFKGEGMFQATNEVYNESANLFADVIKNHLSPEGVAMLADIGSYQGEFLTDVLDKLPEYAFDTIAVEMNENALSYNSANQRVLAGAEKLPFENNSIDIILCRNVLQWNSMEKQKEIVRELARVVHKIAIVQHAGADDISPEEWRNAMDKVFDAKEISQVQRSGRFFSSAKELEDWMHDEKIQFKKVQEKTIENLSDIFIEKYNLPENEALMMKNILGDKDYIQQTTWIIFPSKQD